MRKDTKIVRLPVKSDNNPIKLSHKKKRRLNLVNLVFIVFMLYFIMTAVSQKQMINNLNEQIAQKETMRDSVKKKAESLADDVARIDDQQVLLEVVERVARNEYKMVKPNEIIYIDRNRMNNKFIMGIGYEKDNVNTNDNDKTD